MRRLLVAVAVGVALVGVAAGPAMAGDGVATLLTARADAATVDGQPVAIHVQLRGADGRPVSGAVLRLMIPVAFMGATKNAIGDEATTNDAGKAVLEFSPSQTGSVEVIVEFWGSSGLAPSEATVPFEVRQPILAYRPAPVGLQAWWARSTFILVPFLGVWITYLLVIGLVVRIRRAGVGAAHTVATS